MTVLFRPVGLHELALIWDAGMRGFPPRLPHQPILYPVANIDYARQIARNWNTADEKSGYAGFVTSYDLDESYLSNFEPHTVGSSEHVEYWIPVEDLISFNRAIRGPIHLEDGFFGPSFTTAPSMFLRVRFRQIERAFFSIGCSGRSTTFPNSVSDRSSVKSCWDI